MSIAALRLVVRAAPGWLIAHVALTLAGALLPVAVALLTKLTLDELGGARSHGDLPVLAAALAVLGLLATALPELDQYVRAEQERTAALVAQEQLFLAVDRIVGLRPFEDPRFLDRLRLAQQSGGNTPSGLVDGWLSIARGVLTAAGFLGALLVLSPVMTGIIVASMVPALIAERALARRRAAMIWANSPTERREMLYGFLLVDARAAQEVRLFGIGAFLRGRMLAARRVTDSEHRRQDRRELRYQSGLGLLSAMVAGGGLVFAIFGAKAGTLTIGDVALFVATVGGVQGALHTVVRSLARVHQERLNFEHYLGVTSAAADLPVAADAWTLAPLRNGIELRDVWFRYTPDGPWVLRGVDLVIPHGTSVALVGRNGAGKSTLVKLLCRLYDPTRGSISWDGTDIRDVDPAVLRRRIGAVFQEFVRYDLTGAENIALGDLTRIAERDALVDAARTAGVHEALAALPKGYDTLLSRSFYDEQDDEDVGGMLSGGQWQRIALARCLLRHDRDLLILDEPSSGLDAEAEHEIHDRISRLRSGRTSLLISHRLGAIRSADRIVVLDDGRITEAGSHSALLARNGSYARLFRLQAAGYRDTPVPAAPLS
ncbi:MAG TPA: ABC transporter ATP-binding protein [Actinophytocola sp.]|uniref:ABC transporter ATP-binding protein n=1 Tax=Actinophytocola sp. TaxID=1872138 RepID=UPI002DB9082C|nr:ABC transporter ATP-binding protein [Actinophytocola sp.]HEU5471040.1 ABC transporter ATP-binding protein [Actinophytocola sp.]